MMVLTRSELLRMMSVRRRSSREHVGFGEQLPGVAHGAHGIAYFMRDTGGQPPKGGELGLLHALGQETRVFEENQGRARSDAERREMRANDPGAVRGHEGRRRIILPFALPPGRQRIEQPRRDLAHQSAWDRVRVAENLGCGLIDEANPVLRVDDQHALAQMLHDVLR